MYRKELSYYFTTPVAYIAIALYLLTISLMLWVVPGQWNIIDSGYAQADGLFAISPWLMLLLCPALTMHLFAEEKQTGTWDVLRTKPVSLTRIVLGKFFAAWTIVVLAQLPCLVHLAAVSALAEPAGNFDHGAFLTGCLELLYDSFFLTALGTASSALSKNQIVAFLLAFIAGLAYLFLPTLLGFIQ
ncbi:MAG: ABC transporter permease [Paludibacteraceae bacterium]|nr:ABC transporter permease [Paludibacteraceae bacterium]